MGWMFHPIEAMPAVPRLTGDLVSDPYYRWLNAHFLWLQLPLGLLLFWIGTATGAGGWALVLWGIPLRLVVVLSRHLACELRHPLLGKRRLRQR